MASVWIPASTACRRLGQASVDADLLVAAVIWLREAAFITPTNAAPQQVVALAQASEQAGLDLVTFQDHPYQEGFLDTWTLLSYVAAQTERLHVSGNVINLPLCPPAVLVRDVASLDLPSGGRVELGLGAGACWEAIEAMDGRRLTPAQAVARGGQGAG